MNDLFQVDRLFTLLHLLCYIKLVVKIKFSDHAKDRIKERGISTSLVIKTVNNPEVFEDSFRNRRLFRRNFRGKILEVVAIKDKSLYTVVTAYYLEEEKQ